MAGAAGAGALVAGDAGKGAGNVATLGAGVVPALLPWGAEECPELRGRGGPLSDMWRLPLPWYRRWEPFTAPVAHSPFPCFKRGTIRVVCCELRIE